ncbi:response regulator transcription factor [Paenibacillus sp.]|uniref:response regulator transcription factor n=1 Tax=Paenibacillus sp. TaxID=58172 RepID=UPI0028119F7E|nr:response regulator transcription factor [Paenibacillus sp.]
MYKVFLADDEPFIIEGLYDILDWTELGLEIVGSAGNGREAAAALRTAPADILITDISMPFMNGLELIRDIRGVRPEIRVIVLSGYNEFEYLKEGLVLGIENYLLKPINVDELQATLRNTVEKLDREQELPKLQTSDIGILKENIMYRWVTGGISEAELAERAELLQIDIGRACFFVALLRTDGDPEALYRTAAELLPPDASAVPFHDLNGDVVALFMTDDAKEGKREALERLQRLQRRMEEYGGCRIAIGSVERDVGDVRSSYANAQKAQEYFLLYDRREMLDYASLPIGGDPAPSGLPSEMNYEKLIFAKDEEKLMQRIEADFESFQQLEGMTPGYLQSLAVEMIIQLQRPFRAGQHGAPPPWYSEGIKKAAAAASKEQLLGIVKEAARRMMESLRKDGRSPIVQQVLKHIHESYAESLSLKSMGQRYHVHPVYLGQLFLRETEVTFSEYVNRYRIEQSKRLLKETNEKVQEVAQSVGYWEIGYFYKQFKKYVGLSPTEYRELS